MKSRKDYQNQIKKRNADGEKKKSEITKKHSGEDRENRLKDLNAQTASANKRDTKAISNIEATAKKISELVSAEIDADVLDDAIPGFANVGDKLTQLREKYRTSNSQHMSTLDERIRGRVGGFINEANTVLNAFGYEVRITFGHRSFEEQAKLRRIYEAGGPKAAPAGMSAHNYGLAIDAAVINGSQMEEGDAVWNTVGAIGQKHNMRWGKSFQDKPHFEHPDTPSGSTMLKRYQAGQDVITGESK